MLDLALQRHAFLALAAAALFGASTPFAKLLLGELGHTSPLMLAALLYLGSGVGLALVRLVRKKSAEEAAPVGRDWTWLAGAILVGGVGAPILLLWGLQSIAASEASLLLNLEGVLTTFIAALLFREAVGGRVWTASLVMAAGGFVLAYQPGAAFAISLHAAAIVGACLLWGLDNNLTRKISGSDPTLLAMIKGLAGGGINLALAMASGAAPPNGASLAGGLMLGFFSYGVSLALFIVALRHLGSARTSAHFSTAPFIGAGLSILLLGEPMTFAFFVALACMAVATWLVLTERHLHEHTHEPMRHAHRHVHDEHHRHAHRGDEGPEPHAHEHAHAPVTHAHSHLPDLHHRHGH